MGLDERTAGSPNNTLWKSSGLWRNQAKLLLFYQNKQIQKQKGRNFASEGAKFGERFQSFGRKIHPKPRRKHVLPIESERSPEVVLKPEEHDDLEQSWERGARGAEGGRNKEWWSGSLLPLCVHRGEEDGGRMGVFAPSAAWVSAELSRLRPDSVSQVKLFKL